MKVLSVNVGTTQKIIWKDEVVETAIFKSPVEGPCKISFLQIQGDQQADPRYHGGENKAVYAYDISYYDYWKTILQRDDWDYGLFGENLTTEGLTDDKVFVGDIFKIGSVVLQAIQPRFPCYKLNVRFQSSSMVKLFAQQHRNGTYFKVLQEGFVVAGDSIELLESSPYKISLEDVTHCYYNDAEKEGLLEAVLAIPYLPEDLKEYLRR